MGGRRHTMPLLSSNADQARFAQPGGPTVVLTDFLTVAAIVALVVPRRLLARGALPELAVAAAALAAFALAADRGSIILPIGAALVGRSVYWGLPRLRVVLIVGIAVAAIAAAGFYYRTSQHRDSPFEHEIYTQVLPDVPTIVRPLVPIQIGVAMNFEALARVVDFFPGVSRTRTDDTTSGASTSSRRRATSRRSPPSSARRGSRAPSPGRSGRRGADGGRRRARDHRRSAHGGVRLRGANASAALGARRRPPHLPGRFGFYTNIWTQQVDWLLIAPTLFVCGSVARGAARARVPTAAHADRPDLLGRPAAAATALVALVVAAAAYELVRTRSPRAPRPRLSSRLRTTFRLPAIPSGATVVQPEDAATSESRRHPKGPAPRRHRPRPRSSACAGGSPHDRPRAVHDGSRRIPPDDVERAAGADRHEADPR